MISPEQKTRLVKMHLENDAKEYDEWTREFENIYENIPDSLAEHRAEAVEEERLTKTNATRAELGDQIREFLQGAAASYQEGAREYFSARSVLPGLFSSMITNFLKDVRWRQVGAAFGPDQMEELKSL